MLGAGLAPVGALADAPADAADGDPNHDIVEVSFRETGDDIRITIKVAGRIQPPVAGMESFRIDLRVTAGEHYDPLRAPQLGGAPYTVALARGTNEYGVFRFGAFGYTLPEQPSSGSSSATWKIPKAYLDATLADPPRVGDWITDIQAQSEGPFGFADGGRTLDQQLTRDSDPGTNLHLRRGPSMNQGILALEAPGGSSSATSTLWRDSTLAAEWTSDPVQGSPRLHDLSVILWLSPTLSTPVLAAEDFHVDLYAVQDGVRTLLAQRTEEVSSTNGATTNLFLAPGVPQRMPFQLQALPGIDRVPGGSVLVVRVTVNGFFLQESGPMVVHYDSEDHDSFLNIGKRKVPRPDRSACPHDGNIRTGDSQDMPKPHC